jgi:serine/threonine protein kinase
MTPHGQNESDRMPSVSGPSLGSAGGSVPPEVEGYEIIRILGEGGMGIVYLAHQKQPIQRQVALKVIKAGMDSKEVVARFEVERQALALLDHPNIAQVYDAGATGDGRPYFAMEYVKGLPITEYCDREKLNIQDRLRLFKHVCEGLQHAHHKGIIHRDMKPSNIVAYTEGDEPVAKIIDFGVAKAIGQPLTGRTLCTEAGQFVGTPEYMSPEQADTTAQDIDTRSDIYSLGTVLYELLTGALPFDSETLREGGAEHIRHVIRDENPKTPSTRLTSLGERATRIAQNRRTQVGTLAKRLHRELEWIPLKAMRKDRARRYRSVAEVADDVQRYLDGTPLIAGPESVVYLIRKFVVRNRAFVAGAGLALIVLLASIILSTFFAVRAEYALGDERVLSDWVRQHFFAAIDPAAIEDHNLTLRPMLDAASDSLKRRPLERPLVEAWIRQKILGETYQKLGLHEEAEAHLQHALNLYRAGLGVKCPAAVACMVDLGWVQYSQGRYEQAIRLLADAVDIGKTLPGVEPANLLLSLYLLGCAYLAQDRLDYARQTFAAALDVGRRVLGPEHPATLDLLDNLSNLYYSRSLYADAEPLCREVVFVRCRLDPNDYSTLRSMSTLVALGIKQGHPEAVAVTARRAFDTSCQILGEDAELTLILANNLGVICMEQKRYDEAERLLQKAAEGQSRMLGGYNPKTIGHLVELYKECGRLDEIDSWRAKLPPSENVDDGLDDRRDQR